MAKRSAETQLIYWRVRQCEERFLPAAEHLTLTMLARLQRERTEYPALHTWHIHFYVACHLTLLSEIRRTDIYGLQIEHFTRRLRLHDSGLRLDGPEDFWLLW